MSKHIQSHLITPLTLGYERALTLLRTSSCKLGVQVRSWHQHANMKVWNENLMEDEYHLLIACLAYEAIRGKLMTYYRVVNALLKGHIQDDMLIWNHM